MGEFVVTLRELALLKVLETPLRRNIAKTVATREFSRCLARRRVAILESARRQIAPAAPAFLLLGPRLAPRLPGPWVAGPTRCGGSAAKPRRAPMFCRSCPAGPGCGNSRAKLLPSRGSPPTVSGSSLDTPPSAWTSAMGIPCWAICPSSQVRESRLRPGEALGRWQGARGRTASEGDVAGVARGFEDQAEGRRKPRELGRKPGHAEGVWEVPAPARSAEPLSPPFLGLLPSLS